MRIYRPSTSTITFLMIVSIMISIYGCGKEEKDESVPSSITSTKLSENSVISGLIFSNFKSTNFILDPSELYFSGDKLFLKINRDNNEVLYLGEINRFRVFSINLQVRLSDTKIHYELFTNDISDNTLTGVINL